MLILANSIKRYVFALPRVSQRVKVVEEEVLVIEVVSVEEEDLSEVEALQEVVVEDFNHEAVVVEASEEEHRFFSYFISLIQLVPFVLSLTIVFPYSQFSIL